MTTSSMGPYVQGDKGANMGGKMGCEIGMRSKTQKTVLSWDWNLQLGSMKLETLVIADPHAAVNTFPGLVPTARHTTKVG